jgi:hypothetical protein
MSELIIWSGWVAGAAIGMYLLLQFWLTGKALGCSTGYGNFCGLLTKTSYFRRGEYAKLNNWRLWFALGLPLGGFIAAWTSGVVFQPSFEMGMYEQVLPSALWLRGAFLITGGTLIGYGARLAGGCQSGHAISGMALLNPPSVLASAGFFIGGIVAVQALFGFFG